MALRQAVGARPAALVVDLAAVSEVEPLAGVAAFVAVARAARSRGVPVTVVRAPRPFQPAPAETYTTPSTPVGLRDGDRVVLA